MEAAKKLPGAIFAQTARGERFKWLGRTKKADADKNAAINRLAENDGIYNEKFVISFGIAMMMSSKGSL